MSITTLVFDLDGTLLNTLEDLTDSVNYALSTCGYPLRTLEEIKSFVGNGVEVLMSLAVPSGTSKEDCLECLEIYRGHYSLNLQNKTKPYDGILPMLHRLKEEGYRLAIVSNKYDTAVKALCEDYYSDYITIAIGESKGVNKKPAPDSVYRALELLSSSAEESIYIGDSEVDVLTAHNSGLKCIGVTWGFRDRSVLESKGADYIIDRPEELFEIIVRNN
ncbi:MAG: family hydrolase [Anaerocolumna sp.]|jgi:phosphoglycolate phosphatase|nr:family hydrolase [Anaerocolumna sp.]